MKKLSIFMMALLTMGLMGCSDYDYSVSTSPQSNLPQSQVKVTDVTANATATAIDISKYINEETGTETPIEVATYTVKEGVMPANTYIHADVQVSTEADFSSYITVPSIDIEKTNVIAISPSVLEDEYFNKITKSPETKTVYIRAILYTVTDGTSVAIIGDPKKDFFAQQTTTLTPLMKVKISKNYYIVGGPNDWAASAASKAIKFNHSGEDVYVDPIFTVTFDAAASGDTWFAIGDDEACDAIAAGESGAWDKLLGIVGGDNTAKEGMLDFRYNMKAENSFKVEAGAKKIRVTINMLEYSFKVEVVNISEAYYLIGGEKDWNEAEALKQKFTHSDKSVFEDPVFTFVINGGAERWFSFGDADQIAATTAGDWNQLFGYVGEQGDKGKFARRSDIGAEHTFHLDGSAKHYRFTVNMLTMEYEITPLNFDPFIYFIGATDGWDNENLNRQRLALTDESGIYTGYLYCADPNGWGNEFKFQKVLKDWGSEINSGMMTGGITGDFADGGGNFKANAGEGVYFVTLNMANMSINAVRITNMNLVGDFNGWNQADAAQQMTWDATNYCFVITGAGVNANGWKFTANNAWGINLGGDISDLSQDGSNLSAVGTTIKLYPTRKTSDKIYCTVQ